MHSDFGAFDAVIRYLASGISLVTGRLEFSMITLAFKVSLLLVLSLLGFIFMPMIFSVTLGGMFLGVMFPALVGGWRFDKGADPEKD
ncbi:MAG: hypothetical protein GY822_32460 [Deltaproteobacteria bacterium]|nr:hypothetical protein [Deltaproteobacteria bacterium]